MIILDTESGLAANSLVPLAQQPHLLEFAAIKLDNSTLQQTDELEFLCNPGMPIDPEVTKITGIDDAKVKSAKPFAAHYLSLVRFFLGEEILVAHNLAHDITILSFELERLGKRYQFPWPFRHICTVENTQDIRGKYLKLVDLYEIATGNKPAQTHRAMDDVRLLVECVRWMRTDGRL